MITMQVVARVLEFTNAASVTIEYTINTVQNDTGQVIETLGPVQCTGVGLTNEAGALNIDMTGAITNAINRITAAVAAG